MLRIRIKSLPKKKVLLKKKHMNNLNSYKKLFINEIEDLTFNSIDNWLEKLKNYYKVNHITINNSNKLKKRDSLYQSNKFIPNTIKSNNDLNSINSMIKHINIKLFDFSNKVNPNFNSNSYNKNINNYKNINNNNQMINYNKNLNNSYNSNNKAINNKNINNNNINTRYNNKHFNKSINPKIDFTSVVQVTKNKDWEKYIGDEIKDIFEENVKPNTLNISDKNKFILNNSRNNSTNNNKNIIDDNISGNNIINKFISSNKKITNSNHITNTNYNKNTDYRINNFKKKLNNNKINSNSNVIKKENDLVTECTNLLKNIINNIGNNINKSNSINKSSIQNKNVNNNTKSSLKNVKSFSNKVYNTTKKHYSINNSIINKDIKNPILIKNYYKNKKNILNNSTNFVTKASSKYNALNTNNKKYKHWFKPGSYLHRMNALFNKWKYHGKIKSRNKKTFTKRSHQLIDPVSTINDCLINYKKKFTKYFFYARYLVDDDYGTYIFSIRKMFFNRIYNFFWLHFLHNKYYFNIYKKYKFKLNTNINSKDNLSIITRNAKNNILTSFNSFVNMLLHHKMYVNKKYFNHSMNCYYKMVKSNMIRYLNKFKYKNNFVNINNSYHIKYIRLKKPISKKIIFRNWKLYLKKKSFLFSRGKRLKVRSRKLITKMILSKRIMRWSKKKSYRFKKKYFFSKKYKKFNVFHSWKQSKNSFFFDSKNLFILNTIKYIYNYGIINNLKNWYSPKNNIINPIFLYSQYGKYVRYNMNYNKLFEKNYNTYNYENTSLNSIDKLNKIFLLNRIYSSKDKISAYNYFMNKKWRFLNNTYNKNFLDILSNDYINFSSSNMPYQIVEKKYFFMKKPSHTIFNSNSITSNDSVNVHSMNEPKFLPSHQMSFLNKFYIFYINVIKSSSLSIIFSNTFYMFSIVDLILWKFNLFTNVNNIYFFFRDFFINSYTNFISYYNNKKINMQSKKNNLFFNTFVKQNIIINNSNKRFHFIEYKINKYKYSYSDWLFYISRISNMFLPLFNISKRKKSLYTIKKKKILSFLEKKLNSENYKYNFMKFFNAIRINGNFSNIIVSNKDKNNFMRIYNNFFYFFISRLFNEGNINFYKKYNNVPRLNRNSFFYLNNIEKYNNKLYNFNRNEFSNDINSFRLEKKTSSLFYTDNGRIIIFLLKSLIKNVRDIKNKFLIKDIKSLFIISNLLHMLYNREFNIGFNYNKVDDIDQINNSISNQLLLKSVSLKSYISSKAREYSLIFKNSYSVFMHFINSFKSIVIDCILLNSFSTYKNYIIFFDMRSRNIFYEVNPYQRDYYIKDIIYKNIDHLS